jgi:hypothetical protein
VVLVATLALERGVLVMEIVVTEDRVGLMEQMVRVLGHHHRVQFVLVMVVLMVVAAPPLGV